ncbi:MAG: nitroreductase family protein [Bacteroidales bacterium]
MKVLNDHKSIRKYSDKPVSDELLNEIFFSGTRASTTGNMQVYSIIVTREDSMKEKLSPCHFNQPMIKEAPVVLTFCADFNRFNKWCIQRNAAPGYDNFLSFVTAAIDALLVAQNICIAAENKGLGICYIGTTTYMAEKIIDILELPNGVVPVTTVTLGYPAENPPITDRLPMEAVVHYETYNDFSPADIDRIYNALEDLPSSKQFVRENNLQTLAQVFTDVRYKKADNMAFSNKLLAVLDKQGFMRQ